MSFSIVFLGLSLFTQIEETKDGRISKDTLTYSCGCRELLSVNPFSRIRNAWFIPQMRVKSARLGFFGGRTDELFFSLDGIPLNDPLTGKCFIKLPYHLIPSVSLNRGALSLNPYFEFRNLKNQQQGWHGGFLVYNPQLFFEDSLQGEAEIFFNVPLGKKLAVSLDAQAVQYKNSYPYNISLHHSGLAAWSAAASAYLKASERIGVRAQYLFSECQHDKFSPAWAFNPASTPIEFSEAGLFMFNFNYTTDVLNIDATLSSYNSNFRTGGRTPEPFSILKLFKEQSYKNPFAELSRANPYGVIGMFYSSGNNPYLLTRNSLADRANISTSIQLEERHLLKARFLYAGYNLLSKASTRSDGKKYDWDYQYTPHLGNFYFADSLSLQSDSLWIETGLGLLYMELGGKNAKSSDTASAYKLRLEPRLEVGTLLYGLRFDAGTELSSAPPVLAYYYDGKTSSPNADTLLVIPTKYPEPEEAWRSWFEASRSFGKSFDVGLSGYIRFSYNLTQLSANLKDTASNAPGSLDILSNGKAFAWGMLPWFQFNVLNWGKIRVSYSYALAKGTSQGFRKDYERIVLEDTLIKKMQKLPLDAKHKFVLETSFQTPNNLPFLLKGWFVKPRLALMSGFADEEVGNNSPWWLYSELAAGKEIILGKLRAEIKAELINPFNWTEPIFGKLSEPTLPLEKDFPTRYAIGDANYHPARDINKDGYITAAEEVQAYKAAWKYYQSQIPSPVPARYFNLKFSVAF